MATTIDNSAYLPSFIPRLKRELEHISGDAEISSDYIFMSYGETTDDIRCRAVIDLGQIEIYYQTHNDGANTRPIRHFKMPLLTLQETLTATIKELTLRLPPKISNV